jgi:hypothetical protein
MFFRYLHQKFSGFLSFVDIGVSVQDPAFQAKKKMKIVNQSHLSTISTHMNQYQQLASELLRYELSPDKQEYCISLYQPNDSYSKPQLFHQLKAIILKALRSDKQLKHSSSEDELIEAIREQVFNLDQLLSGVAVFLRLRSNGNKLMIADNKVHCITLLSKPVSEYFTGKRFSVEQLMMIASAVTDALIVDLKRNEFFIYRYSNHEIEEVAQGENEYIEEDVNRYIEMFSTHGLDITFHGTGRDKYQRRMLKQNELFLKEVLDRVRKYPQSFEHLLIFYSEWFKPFIHKYLSDISNSLHKTQLIAVEKNIKKRDIFIKEAQEQLKDRVSQRKHQVLEELEQQHQMVIETWPEIAQAVRNKQIRRLMIKPNISVSGYVTQDGLIYTQEPEAKAVKVNNIVPWIVAATAQQDGEIYVFTQDELETRPHMLAQLRYQLEDGGSNIK